MLGYEEVITSQYHVTPLPLWIRVLILVAISATAFAGIFFFMRRKKKR
jgi:hypothetical protein